jgi:hypothetical protein
VVSGTCQDVAGKVGNGSFAVNYDATPPLAPSVDLLPGDRQGEGDLDDLTQFII